MQGDDAFLRLIKKRHHDRGIRASLLLFCTLFFLVFVVIWAAYTEIDDVVRADGRVVPKSSLQTLQAPESGSVRNVFVREGDIVEAGQVLMEMDQTRFAGHLDQEQQHFYALQARLIRLRSEVSGDPLDFPEALEAQARDVVASERSLFRARQTEFNAEREVLAVQRERQIQALAEAQNLLEIVDRTYRLTGERVTTLEPLVERGLEPQTSLLQLQIEVSEAQGRLAQSSSRLVQEQSRLTEIESRMKALESQFHAKALEDLSRTTNELAALAPSVPVLEQRVRDTEIRSPVDGVVNQIFVSSLGGIAGMGDDLIEIVPINEMPVVEAFVRPSNIAFLYLGQSVNVKVTAYDFSRYGALSGEIQRIGAGPVLHPERDDSVFAVEVVTTNKLRDASEQPLPILPGMIAEIEFVSERKTVLDYITQPVVRVRDRAFRD